MAGKTRPISVQYEWGRLKEAVVGNPATRLGSRLPKVARHYMPPKTIAFIESLHLDCVLATPRPGLALVCRAGFLDGLPAFLKGWQLVEVSARDAEEKLAANGLVLDERTILVAAELPRLADALSKAGQEVVTTPFSAVYLWGGAFRCWHHPLVREGGDL
jgi:N-dimethylarginine dimethylaminohydrolase